MLVWRGEEVKDATLRATGRAGDSILSDCVIEAKNTVPVRTSALQGSIQMRPMQMTSAKGMRGLFGSFSINYAAAVEFGTPPHIIRPKIKKALWWKGLEHPVRLVHHPGTRARPFLLPAADKFFPQFAGRIREELGNG